MLHVPDVRATAAWYESIGFAVTGRHEDCGALNWARVDLNGARVMFTAGGEASQAPRRSADLYVQTDRLDALFASIAVRAEVIEGPHDTEYGMREFIVRDCNGFWLSFGQELL